MAIEKIEAFKTSDGSIFDTCAEAEKHDDGQRLRAAVQRWVGDGRFDPKGNSREFIAKALIGHGHEIGVTITNLDRIAFEAPAGVVVGGALDCGCVPGQIACNVCDELGQT